MNVFALIVFNVYDAKKKEKYIIYANVYLQRILVAFVRVIIVNWSYVYIYIYPWKNERKHKSWEKQTSFPWAL